MGGPKPTVKSFGIDKRLVYGAWVKVRANPGAPDVDAVHITEFADRERDNLYLLWNRMSSGSYFPGTGSDLAGLAEAINPQVRSWFGFYGAFYRSELSILAKRIDEHLVAWAMHKFKRLRGRPIRAWAWLSAVRQREPRLFAHWHLLPVTPGRPVGAV
jgi:hypothetical protein